LPDRLAPELGGTYGYGSASYAYSTTYRTGGLGVGFGYSLPKLGTGAYLVGTTTLIGKPYYFNENEGIDPDLGHIIH